TTAGFPQPGKLGRWLSLDAVGQTVGVRDAPHLMAVSPFKGRRRGQGHALAVCYRRIPHNFGGHADLPQKDTADCADLHYLQCGRIVFWDLKSQGFLCLTTNWTRLLLIGRLLVRVQLGELASTPGSQRFSLGFSGFSRSCRIESRSAKRL